MQLCMIKQLLASSIFAKTISLSIRSKSTALNITIDFLAMNDLSIDYDENALEQLTRSVAEGQTKKASIASSLANGPG